MFKRMLCIMITISLMLGAVSVRLYLLSSGGVRTAASVQGRYTVTVSQPRGTVYDCRMRRLTNTTLKTVAVIQPTAESVAAISEYSGDNAANILERLKSGKPILAEVPSDFECETAYIFTVPAELAADQLACHIIGYVDGEGRGVAGIQRAYNELLESKQPLRVTYTVDASGRPLAGVSAKLSGRAENLSGVVLTIDSQLQRIAEIAGQRLAKGAVIIMESTTGRIRASASFPAFSPNDVSAVLDNADAPLVNRALCAYNVGSVFKLCVSAAALRQNISTKTMFECLGYTDIGNTRFNCNKHSGHGSLDMTKALADSCNCYFISLGKTVGASVMYDTCLRFGFNRAYLLCDGMTAQGCILPSLSEIMSQPAALANLSFGQGDLMLTPLHIAVMTATIANGGKLVTPSIVEATVDGEQIEHLSAAPSRQILSAYNTEVLRSMMEAVIIDGTGTAAKPEQGIAGGKTATAETGWYIEDRPVTQSWFAGYYGDYTVVVLKEDGRSGSADCAPVFKAICDAISEL